MGIQGTTVTLYERTETGTDDFNAPVYEETPVEVADVLIGQPTDQEKTDSMALYGKRLAYVLGIPRGDAHDWENARVDFFGQSFRAYGFPVEGIEANIPLKWHKKVMVERFG